jgi:L-amino acid N-acyltransferase YncA
MKIREATLEDSNAIWDIFSAVIKTGDTYVFDPETKKEDLPKYWFASNMKTYVAEKDNRIIGTYFIKPNQIDLGSHIANCGYMVDKDARGLGAGKQMYAHSVELAKSLGYKAMQFNFVVSTNESAVQLWQKSGFRIIGTIPKGFKHSKLGYVDAYIMFMELN